MTRTDLTALWRDVAAEADGLFVDGDEFIEPTVASPTPEQEAAWRQHVSRLRLITDEPTPTHEPGDPVHISTALGRVLDSLAAGSQEPRE